MNVTTTKLNKTEFLATLDGLKSNGVTAEIVTKAQMKDATLKAAEPALTSAIQLQRSKMQTPTPTSKFKNS